MARLSLTLLGPLDIRLDGRPIAALAYDKVWALLAYLAIEAERPHRRDALIGLLWPDQAERAARTNLRQALSQLRQALGDHMVEPPFLLIERETVQFNCASDHDLDVCVFEALLAGCDAHPHRRLDTCTACALRLGEAATLYRGGFLEEFAPDGAAAFEEWALLKREELHHRACQALARLAAYHERCGDYEQVRRYVRRWLQLEPWEEAAHRQAMRAFAAAGQRSASMTPAASYLPKSSAWSRRRRRARCTSTSGAARRWRISGRPQLTWPSICYQACLLAGRLNWPRSPSDWGGATAGC